MWLALVNGYKLLRLQNLATDLKFCLPFLRCFGAKVLGLIFESNHAIDKRIDYLDQYINQYCADTLCQLTFLYDKTFAIGNFPKPFKNVKNIELFCVNLGKNLLILANIFPNPSHLTMTHVFIDETAIAMSFSHLKCLNLEIREKRKNHNNDYTPFTNENIDIF